MARMSDQFVVGRVIGEVIGNFTPSVKISVTYNSKVHVYNGHDYFPSSLTTKHWVEVHGDDMRTFFNLVMTDSDVPSLSDRYLREHLHWIVTDIPDGCYVWQVVEYEIPRPNVGIHRFVFILYKQKRRDVVRHCPSSRDVFSSVRFSEENDLGLPVAAVDLNAQRENAVRRR